MKIAALQLCSQGDVGSNLRAIDRILEDVAKKGGELVLLPEAFAFLGLDGGRADFAEVLGERGMIQDALKAWARKHRIVLVAGGMAEVSPDSARPYNTSVVFSPEGEIISYYRKIHLFDVELEGGVSFKESKTTHAGTLTKTFDAGEWRVGLSICYDLRFAELYAWQRQQGAQLLTVPAAFTQKTGVAHWHVLLRARAIENQAWLLAAGQEGEHPGGRQTFGHSMIVDPWGRVVAERRDAGEGFVVADISLTTLASIRTQMPAANHRRLP